MEVKCGFMEMVNIRSKLLQLSDDQFKHLIDDVINERNKIKKDVEYEGIFI